MACAAVSSCDACDEGAVLPYEKGITTIPWPVSRYPPGFVLGGDFKGESVAPTGDACGIVTTGDASG